jgi:hypothetical protein
LEQEILMNLLKKPSEVGVIVPFFATFTKFSKSWNKFIYLSYCKKQVHKRSCCTQYDSVHNWIVAISESLDTRYQARNRLILHFIHFRNEIYSLSPALYPHHWGWGLISNRISIRPSLHKYCDRSQMLTNELGKGKVRRRRWWDEKRWNNK